MYILRQCTDQYMKESLITLGHAYLSNIDKFILQKTIRDLMMTDISPPPIVEGHYVSLHLVVVQARTCSGQLRHPLISAGP